MKPPNPRDEGDDRGYKGKRMEGKEPPSQQSGQTTEQTAGADGMEPSAILGGGRFAVGWPGEWKP